MDAVRYRKIVLFQNPASGAPNPELRRRIRERLEAISDSLIEVVVDRDLNLAGRAAETVQENADLVVVAGGDGTVREVAGALVSTDMTLAIIPLGTFNNLALSLKLPLDPDAICDLIEAGLTRRIDVGMADEQHAFFEVAGVGVDADLFPIGEEVKSGRFHGIGRAIRLALLHRQASVELRFDRSVSSAYQNSFRGTEPLKRRRRRFRDPKEQSPTEVFVCGDRKRPVLWRKLQRLPRRDSGRRTLFDRRLSRFQQAGIAASFLVDQRRSSSLQS